MVIDFRIPGCIMSRNPHNLKIQRICYGRQSKFRLLYIIQYSAYSVPSEKVRQPEYGTCMFETLRHDIHHHQIHRESRNKIVKAYRVVKALETLPRPIQGIYTHGHDAHAITASIMEVASDFCHSQYMTPPFHPFSFACFTHEFKVEALMYPFAAPPSSRGLPMTILLSGTDE